MKNISTIPEFETRSAVFESRTGDTIIVSFASDALVSRPWGEIEILDIGGMDVSRVRSGAVPFLWNHDHDRVLGVVERVWADGNKAKAEIRWSKNKFASECRAEVEDGIISNMSCGYRILEFSRPLDTGKDVTTVTRWEICELTLCSVPADAGVGVGRSLSANKIELPPLPHASQTMTVTDEARDLVKDERDRIISIRALADTHGHRELADKLISDGATIDQARGAYLDQLPPQQPVSAATLTPLSFGQEEQKQYSVVKAIRAAADGDWSKAKFERECHEELLKRSGKASVKGVLVPMMDLELRAPYQTSPAAQGGSLVSTDLLVQNFIDILRNRTMVVQLGAQMLSGLEGNISIPRQNTATATYWVAENGAITQAEATFDQVPLTPKTIAARSQMSRNLLLQSSLDVEQFVRNDFAAVIARGIDLAAISGSGVSNEPRGILNQAGINSVALGTNGAAPAWDDIVRMETLVAADNADIGSLAYLTNAQTRGKLKTTLKASAAGSDFIWSDDMQSEGIGMVNGYRAGCSNQVPSALTKGTGTGLSAILFGNWSDVLIGEWGVMEVLPNPYGAGYNSGALDIRVMQTVDIAIRHPESFCAITDAITV